ncbi:glutamate racemase [Porphyromonadaceae bacterium OttesenSCG-928-L07]|nr:glutamate racemase [Porphyromonadaceae bacterium OttesenSCG-928-L07]MDL2251887.1 glutamate racemase [Odoribacter sp. OttesenSCG-928-J03]MDL2283384.1 glutamate racemase [Odoribacter sp. OttesenSCG-928-G04]
MNKNCPIGIFDSGYGGLTILKEVVKLLPEYDYIYLGDNARTPYGTRSFDVVYSYTRESVLKLFEMGCKLVILACNTASAKALRTIQQRDLPLLDPSLRVLGIIRPSVESFPVLSTNHHIGILGTKGTVSSGSYLMESEKLYGKTAFQITQVACPLLVPLIESNELQGEGTEFFVKKYIRELLQADPDIDTIVLACTHYPLLKDLIRRNVPEQVKVVEQGQLIASSLQDYLHRHPEMEREISRGSSVRYFTTEKADLFADMVEVFMGGAVEAEEIKI